MDYLCMSMIIHGNIRELSLENLWTNYQWIFMEFSMKMFVNYHWSFHGLSTDYQRR